MGNQFKAYQYDRNSIIDKINTLRGKKRIDGYWNNERLADILDVDISTVKRWLNKKGKTEIPTEYLIKICNLFECDIDYLLGRIELKTKMATDIHKATGLSEEAIAVLSSQDSMTSFKRELTNELIEQSSNYDSLAMSILNYLMDKKKIQQYKEAPNFKAIQQIYDHLFPPEKRRPFDIKNIQNEVDNILDSIYYYLEQHYDYEKVPSIHKATHGYYQEYYMFEGTKELVISTLQNKLVRFLDSYSLKGDVVEWQRIEDEEEARILAEWQEQSEEENIIHQELMEGDNNGNDN